MLLNRVRCEAMEKIRVYFDRNLCRFLPPKESIFLICDTLLSLYYIIEARICRFFYHYCSRRFFSGDYLCVRGVNLW